MNRVLLGISWVIFFCVTTAKAQDYSNRGLMDIKEKVEGSRVDWNKAFDQAVVSGKYSDLRTLREKDERYIDDQLSALRRLYAQGDGRALLNAINNYLRIQKQFVRDVMVPAETITGTEEELNTINEKIVSFGEKEKVFLVEINNAIVMEGLDGGPDNKAKVDEEMESDDFYDDQRGSVLEGRMSDSPRKANKKERRKHKKHSTNSEEEGDEDK